VPIASLERPANCVLALGTVGYLPYPQAEHRHPSSIREHTDAVRDPCFVRHACLL